ncbi:unnamed protein product [Rotaria sp. Silwood1]|nr:unnamed protein product [Rotaria sp. Silwood1]
MYLDFKGRVKRNRTFIENRKENRIKLDDYFDETNHIHDPNASYISNTDTTEKTNVKLQYRRRYACKRIKFTNNINFIDNYDRADDVIIPEDVIVCEKQELLFCGRHALRALVQNVEIFDDTNLISLAKELATQEIVLHQDISIYQEFYFNHVTGYYHIEIT